MIQSRVLGASRKWAFVGLLLTACAAPPSVSAPPAPTATPLAAPTVEPAPSHEAATPPAPALPAAPPEPPARLVDNGPPLARLPLPRGALKRVGAGRLRMLGFSLSHDGNTLAGRPEGEPLGLFDTRTHRRLRSLSVPIAETETIAFSPDGKHVAVRSDSVVRGANEDTVRVFDVRTGALRATVAAGATLRLGPYWSADGSHLGLLMYGSETSTKLLTIEARSSKRRSVPLAEGEYTSSTALAISPGAREMVIAYHGGSSQVIDAVSLDTGARRAQWRADRGDVNELVYSPDGRVVAASGAAGYLWEAATGAPAIAIDEKVDAVRFGPGQHVLFSNGKGIFERAYDGTPRERASDAALVRRYPACGPHLGVDAGVITSVADGGGGPRTCAYSRDTGERLTLSAAAEVSACDRPIRFSASGREVLLHCPPDLETWDVGQGKLRKIEGAPRVLSEIGREGTHEADAWARIAAKLTTPRLAPLALPSPDGKRLAVPAEGAIILVEVSPERVIANLPTACLSVWAFSADSRRLAVGDCGPIGIYDTATGQRVTSLARSPRGGAPRYLMFTPDGRHVLSRDANGMDLYAHRAADGSLAGATQGGAGNVWSMDLSPDGARVAVGLTDGLARVFEVPSFRAKGTLTGHDGVVEGVAFSPDGARLVTIGAEGTMLVWDTAKLP